MLANKKKPGPGRPKKVIVRKKLAFEGIATEPSNVECKDPRAVRTMEIFYQNPAMFKRIFSLFKSMSVDSAKVRFEPDCIKMVTADRIGQSTIFIKIFGNQLNRYYCEKTLEVGLNSLEWQKILNSLAKDHSRIDMVSVRRTERSKISTTLYDDVMSMEDYYEVDINSVDEEEWEVEEELALEEEFYPIKFEIPFKLFKRKVSDFKSLSDIMVVRKVGHGPLMLSHSFTNKRGMHNTIFRNGGKINIISTVDDDDMFFASVFLDYIRPLSTSLISDVVQISVSKDHKIIFTCYLDQDEDEKTNLVGTETCVIKILTAIVDLKKKNEVMT